VALLANIHQGQKGLPETNTKAYFGTFKSFEEIFFLKKAPTFYQTNNDIGKRFYVIPNRCLNPMVSKNHLEVSSL